VGPLPAFQSFLVFTIPPAWRHYGTVPILLHFVVSFAEMTATLFQRDIRRLSDALGERDSESPGILLTGVSWELYEQLLEVVGDRPIRLTYDEGDLEIMPPLRLHEKSKKLIARMIELLSLELRIPIESGGSSTFRRRRLAKGLEPDECYYIAHEANVRDGRESDLDRDPPPDLVVEIDITHRAVDREKIYLALGVPELWKFNGERLIALKLTPRPTRAAKGATSITRAEIKKRKYVPIERSLAFPFLEVAELAQFLAIADEAGESAAIFTFQDWVRRRHERPAGNG
jgi:Uma2 family endonuclease